MEEAQKTCTKALAGADSTFGQTHVETFSVILDLGIIYRDQGQLDQSERILKRVNECCQESTHPLLPLILNALGILHAFRSNYEEAGNKFDSATKSLSNTQKEGDFLRLIIEYNRGSLLQSQGKLEEAEAHYQISLEGFQDSTGHNHVTTIAVVLKLGAVYLEQGKFNELEELYKGALENQAVAEQPENNDANDTVLYFQRMSIPSSNHLIG